MKAILAIMIKNLVGMMLTERMIIWALEVAVKQTKNSIDDNVVALLKAAYQNDEEGFKMAVESLANRKAP